MHKVKQSIHYGVFQLPHESHKKKSKKHCAKFGGPPSGAVGWNPEARHLTAALICMLVSNNAAAKCSSECSFLLPSHETSAPLRASLG